LPLIDVVKEWHGRRPVGRDGSESAVAEALLAILACVTIFLRWLPPIMLKTINPHQTPFCFAQSAWACAAKCVVFEDADFGLQAARDAGMDAVDVRLL
jgi:beta-phosphoglucomutase-like phosphatase (HAD superfamily)